MSRLAPIVKQAGLKVEWELTAKIDNGSLAIPLTKEMKEAFSVQGKGVCTLHTDELGNHSLLVKWDNNRDLINEAFEEVEKKYATVLTNLA